MFTREWDNQKEQSEPRPGTTSGQAHIHQGFEHCLLDWDLHLNDGFRHWMGSSLHAWGPAEAESPWGRDTHGSVLIIGTADHCHVIYFTICQEYPGYDSFFLNLSTKSLNTCIFVPVHYRLYTLLRIFLRECFNAMACYGKIKFSFVHILYNL